MTRNTRGLLRQLSFFCFVLLIGIMKIDVSSQKLASLFVQFCVTSVVLVTMAWHSVVPAYRPRSVQITCYHQLRKQNHGCHRTYLHPTSRHPAWQWHQLIMFSALPMIGLYHFRPIRRHHVPSTLTSSSSWWISSDQRLIAFTSALTIRTYTFSQYCSSGDVHGNGNNPMGPIGFPREWEWQWLYHGNRNGSGNKE